MKDKNKHSLGFRAFVLFFVRRSKLLSIFIAISVVLWYAERFMSPSYFLWGQYAANLFGVFTLAFFVMVLLRVTLEYRFYTYTFTNDAFVMTQGYIVRNEVATLYHQIQNVNIKRSPVDRMVGVSQIVILMSGSAREHEASHIILPALSKKKAAYVQKEILARARKQHVAESEPRPTSRNQTA